MILLSIRLGLVLEAGRGGCEGKGCEVVVGEWDGGVVGGS